MTIRNLVAHVVLVLHKNVNKLYQSSRITLVKNMSTDKAMETAVKTEAMETAVKTEAMETAVKTEAMETLVKTEDCIETQMNSFKIDTTPYTVVEENTTKVLFPNTHDVFYNPVQQFNRDISVAVLRLFAKDHLTHKDAKRKTEATENKVENVTMEDPTPGAVHEDGIVVLEALAASGIRSIRFAQEVGGIKSIVANDRSTQAYESLQRNIEFNNVQHLVKPECSDASYLMYGHRAHTDKFDVIDLDPYGSPTIFLDGAVQSVKDGGLLMVTCTDMAVLCGNAAETCFVKYGSVAPKVKCCHETALRIVLHCIQSHANRYGRYIVPQLSLSVDFYVRVFVKIFTSPVKCKQTASKTAMLYSCPTCDSWVMQPMAAITKSKKGNTKYTHAKAPTAQPNCQHCGHDHQISGPLWATEIHNAEFVRRLRGSIGDNLHTHHRIRGMLSLVEEELQDVPLFYQQDRLVSVMKTSSIPMLELRSAILNAGYRVSLSHCGSRSVKTDAPTDVVWDIMRCHVARQPPKKTPLDDSTAGHKIMSVPTKVTACFDVREDANPPSRVEGLLRFQVNPEKNWGPGARSKTSLLNDGDIDTVSISKRKKNQDKHKIKRLKEAEENREAVAT